METLTESEITKLVIGKERNALLKAMGMLRGKEIISDKRQCSNSVEPWLIRAMKKLNAKWSWLPPLKEVLLSNVIRILEEASYRPDYVVGEDDADDDADDDDDDDDDEDDEEEYIKLEIKDLGKRILKIELGGRKRILNFEKIDEEAKEIDLHKIWETALL